jgi:uncharacterized protein (TIGR03437 family)
MRFFLLALTATLVARAQFTAISASDDGRQLYVTTQFVTDGIQNPAGTPPPSRIFQIAGGNATVLLSPASRLLIAFSGPEVSADGSVFGFTINQFCSTAPCGTQDVESFLQSPTSQDLGPGTLQLSRNGQWALMIVPDDPFSGGPPGATNPPGHATLKILQTGVAVSVPLPPAGARAIASDGSVLTSTGIWKAGTLTPVQYGPATQFGAVTQVLSDDASTLVFLNPSQQLIAHDVASGSETTLSSQAFPTNLISVSVDGRYVLYSGAPALPIPGGSSLTLVADARTGQNYPIPLDPGEAMVAGVLNSTGTLAFIATNEGRIVQAALSSGQTTAVTELLPGVNYLNNVPALSPGSLTRLSASFASDVMSLQGKLLIDDQPLTVLAVDGKNLTVQIPWEVRTGSRPLDIGLRTASPFYQGINVNVIPAAFRFEPSNTGRSLFGFKFLNEDFSALAINPLPAGAILHVYATGMGPVTGTVQTGMPVPDGALIPIQGSMTCRFLPQQSNARTLFAGLAPGTVGVYQVDFQLPDEGAPVNVTGLTCTLSGLGFSTMIGASMPPPM